MRSSFISFCNYQQSINQDFTSIHSGIRKVYSQWYPMETEDFNIHKGTNLVIKFILN